MAEIRKSAEGDVGTADVLVVRDEYWLQERAQIHRRCRESGLSNCELCRCLSRVKIAKWHRAKKQFWVRQKNATVIPQIGNIAKALEFHDNNRA